jgi:hypothetical protein
VGKKGIGNSRMKFKQFLEERTLGKVYEFSSSQYDLYPHIAHDIYSWGLKNIPDDVLDLVDGRQSEDDVHCTILYGIITSEYKDITPYVQVFNPFEVELGEISLFKNDKQDVVKISVKDNFKLNQLHNFLKNNVKNEYKFPSYVPHITVAYVKPNTCDHLVGDKSFDGVKLLIDSITFSSKYGMKTPISFYGKNLNKHGQI